MANPFVGSEAVAAGAVTKSELRTSYKRLLRDVYVVRGTELTPGVLAAAGWLWSRRSAVVAGRSAAAVLGAQWLDLRPIELRTAIAILFKASMCTATNWILMKRL